MKKILLFGLFGAFTIATSTAQDLKNLKRIEIDGNFSNPVVSPNGKLALVTTEHAKGVFLINLQTQKALQISDKEGSGYGYSWNKNSQEVYFKQKEKGAFFADAKSYTFNIETQKTSELQEINHNFLPSFTGYDKGDSSSIVVYTDINTLKIHAKDLVSQKDWIVTNDEGQFYNAILSHDAKKVAVHNGANVFIYDIQGKEKPVNLGMGIATAWSPSDKYLIGFLDESADGHSITNSEIYMFSPDQKAPVKVTNTEVFSEMFPSFVNENTILFSDDKTGRLFTIDIK